MYKFYSYPSISEFDYAHLFRLGLKFIEPSENMKNNTLRAIFVISSLPGRLIEPL